jgi:hypothetical protein
MKSLAILTMAAIVSLPLLLATAAYAGCQMNKTNAGSDTGRVQKTTACCSMCQCCSQSCCK